MEWFTKWCILFAWIGIIYLYLFSCDFDWISPITKTKSIWDNAPEEGEGYGVLDTELGTKAWLCINEENEYVLVTHFFPCQGSTQEFLERRKHRAVYQGKIRERVSYVPFIDAIQRSYPLGVEIDAYRDVVDSLLEAMGSQSYFAGYGVYDSNREPLTGSILFKSKEEEGKQVLVTQVFEKMEQVEEYLEKFPRATYVGELERPIKREKPGIYPMGIQHDQEYKMSKLIQVPQPTQEQKERQELIDKILLYYSNKPKSADK